MNNILKIKNLTYSFGKNKILKDINLYVNSEETVAIIGTSGVGKSTLFNLIAGILEKQDGEIYIEDSKDYIGKVAYMLQKDLLFEHKTIIENIVLPLIINKKRGDSVRFTHCLPSLRRPKPQQKSNYNSLKDKKGETAEINLLSPPKPQNKRKMNCELLSSLLELLTNSSKNKKEIFEEGYKILKEFGLEEYANKYPKQLSGGMRQRIALIRTYMMKRKLFLLDEAFSALDTITKRELHFWYKEISKKLKFTTILITHDIDEAVSLSDRIYILGNKPGEILEEIIIDIKKSDDKSYEDFQRLKYKNKILEIMKIK